MAESTKRVFASLTVPDDVKQKIQNLSQIIPGVHWHPVDNFHITLKFIGNITPDQEQLISSLLEYTANQYKSFEIGFDNFRVQESRLRLLVKNPLPILDIRNTIELNLGKIGLGQKEPMEYLPHITLGKIAQDASNPQPDFDYDALTFPAIDFTLYETIKGDKAAIFKPLQKFTLQ